MGLSPIRPQDRPAREEGGPQGRQRPQRDVPQASLELSNQVVEEADERRAASVPAKRREQNPSAPKACVSSLMRFSLSARPLQVRQTVSGGMVSVVTTAWKR